MSMILDGASMQEHMQSSLKGQLLIAMPSLEDPNFFQTVSCICEHNQDGAVGIVTNRVFSSLAGQDIFEELDINYVPEMADLTIHSGGPVRIDELFLLHGPPLDWEGSLLITPHIALSNTLDVIKALAAGQGPAEFILALGCAGWGPGQLEFEIRQNAWLNHPISEEIIFRTGVDEQWKKAMKISGVDPTFFSETAGHA
jgi:putative transcriptional regulator